MNALLLLLPQLALAGIIGQDNLIPYKDLGRFSVPEMAKATATQISLKRVISIDSENSAYPAATLQNLCPGDRFKDNKILGGCSAFLVGKDILVTAGHCNPDYVARRCDGEGWLFNHNANVTGDRYPIKNRDVYRCTEVLDVKHSDGVDYAVVRLDRPVAGATPFVPNLGNDVYEKDPLAVMGYPLGLPFTYTPGGNVLSFDRTHMQTDLDGYTKNSGSVVVNLRTGRAEGILTNGTAGLSINPLDGCQETLRLAKGVTYINRLDQIPYLRQNYRTFSNKKVFTLSNQCGTGLNVIAKFRSLSDSSFATKTFTLAVGETLQLDTALGSPMLLFARDNAGNKLVSGKDFYGFENQGREDEFGFKEFTAEQISLCR
jgi:V8-like Glu-specific endopeptidase